LRLCTVSNHHFTVTVQRPMEAQVVYLTRHGHRLDWEDKTWALTAPDAQDPPLSSTGLHQAHELAQRLKSETLTRILCSPYTRCLQTGTEVSRANVVPVFIEFGISEWLPKTAAKSSLTHVNLPDWPAVSTEYNTITHPSPEESAPSLFSRCYEFVKGFEKMDMKGCTLLVTHAAPLIALVRAFLRDRSFDIAPGTCSLTKLVRQQDGTWKLEGKATASHLSGGAQDAWKFPSNLEEVISGSNFT